MPGMACGRVALDEFDQATEAHAFGQAPGSQDPRLCEVQSRHATAKLVGEPARGTAHAAANIQDVLAPGEPSRRGKGLDRLHTAVVILVEVLQLLLGQRREVQAAGGKLLEDLVFVDRVRLVEAGDSGSGAVVHQARVFGGQSANSATANLTCRTVARQASPKCKRSSASLTGRRGGPRRVRRAP
jgi:hypothetical protein